MTSATSAANAMLQAALAYAKRDWAVLPVRAGGKVPLTGHGVHDASCDEATIRTWWEKWPSANVAIACGAVSGGLVVLDCDEAEFAWALKKACGPLPETLTVLTGRGSHRYFVASEGIRTQQLAPHLELRGEGSYVLAPPSVHSNGARYRIVKDMAAAPLPDTLREPLRKPAARAAAATHIAIQEAEKIHEGERDITLTSLGGTMRRRGITREGIEAALLAENQQRCEPPLPEAEVRKIAASVSRYKSAPKKATPPAATVAAPPAAVLPPAGLVLTAEQAQAMLADLLFAIGGFLSSYLAISTTQTHVLAVWVFHTHTIDACDRTPYLHIRSPEKRCGKSLLLDLLKLLVWNPWRTSNASPAAIPRKISGSRPTALFDEADTYLRSEDERGETLRGVLDAGFERGGAYSRCVGQDAALKVEDFDVFCPKAIAGLRDLPDTIADRSIPIKMKRALAGEIRKRFYRREVEPTAAKLRERIEACATALISALQEARPGRIPELNDRENDIVEPLLAIADLAGDGWPEYLRGFLRELFQAEEEADQSLGIRLLSDAKEVFGERGVERLASADLVQALRDRPDAPWADWRGKGLTTHMLTRMLRGFQIEQARWAEGKTVRGYERRAFAEAWSRYLPAHLPGGGQSVKLSESSESTS